MVSHVRPQRPFIPVCLDRGLWNVARIGNLTRAIKPAWTAEFPPSQLQNGSQSLFSEAYMFCARASCFWLLVHRVRMACCLALASAGSNNAARMAMMMITTSSSMSVKAEVCAECWPVAEGAAFLSVVILLGFVEWLIP